MRGKKDTWLPTMFGTYFPYRAAVCGKLVNLVSSNVYIEVVAFKRNLVASPLVAMRCKQKVAEHEKQLDKES